MSRLPNAEHHCHQLQERLREAEALLSEILRLSYHLERNRHAGFLALSHENRIRKFLCVLPRPTAQEIGAATQGRDKEGL
jgi:hypothetical protein